MTLVMVVTRPMEGKTNRNAIIVPVTTSPETRGVGESNRLAENDASCEMSEPDRTKEQVDGASTFIPPTRSDFKVLSGIVEKILTSEQKSNSTLKKKKLGEHSEAQVTHIKIFQKERRLLQRVPWKDMREHCPYSSEDRGPGHWRGFARVVFDELGPLHVTKSGDS